MPKQKVNQILFWISIVLCLAIYLPNSNSPFSQLDDCEQVLENPNLRSMDLGQLKAIFTSTSVGMYQPLSTVFYAIVWQIFGPHSQAFHLLSLVFHLLNAFLVWRLFGLLGLREFSRSLAFALFLLHPLQVEAVSWISAFSTLCFTFFFLLSIISYLKYNSLGESRYFWASLILFALSCLAKSAAIVLPVFLLAIDYFHHSKSGWKALLNKIPFLVLSLLFGIITLMSRETAGHLSDLSSDFSLVDRYFMICYNFLFYPIKAIMPFKLSIYYPFPELSGGFLPPFFYLAGIAIPLLALLIWRKKMISSMGLGLGFYLGAMVLLIQLIPIGNQLNCERYFYLSSVGLLYLLCQFIERKKSTKMSYLWFLFPLLWSPLSYQAAERWKSDELLWKNVLEQFPETAQAHNNLGSIELDKQNLSLALEHFNQAIDSKSSYADAYSNRGMVYSELNQAEKAIADYNRALKLRPHADAYFNRGNEWVKLGEFEKGINDYGLSLGLKPSPDTYTNRSYAFAQVKLFDEAFHDLNMALSLDPNFAQAYFLRALLYRSQNQMQKACADFKQAARRNHSQAKQAVNQFCP